jgi:hypothetical protein
MKKGQCWAAIQGKLKMDLEIDPDVKAVLRFMQQTLPPAKLVPVATGVAALSLILWKKYTPEKVEILSLASPQGCAVRNGTSQPTANGLGSDSSDAGGGSGAVTDAGELM